MKRINIWGHLFSLDVAVVLEFALKCHQAVHDETTVSEVAVTVAVTVAAANVAANVAETVVVVVVVAIGIGTLTFVSVERIFMRSLLIIFCLNENDRLHL